MFNTYFSILIYPILNVILLTIFGFGLSIIFLPKSLKPYTVLLSPLVSILFSICFLVIVSLLGFSVYQASPFLIGFFIIMDFIAFLFHKKEIHFSVIRDGILLTFVVFSIIFNLSPLLRREKILTVISMGNNDVIVYATVADYLRDHSISESFQQKVPSEVSGLLHAGYRWGTPMINAFFLNLFNLQGYQYTYISQVVLFSLLIPLSYVLFELLFRKSIMGMIAVGIFTAWNVNLMYMLYHDFFGQVLFWGIEMMLMIFVYAYLQSSELKKNALNIYDYCISVIIAVLFFSYHEPAILLLSPIIISILLYFLVDRRKTFTILLAVIRIGLITFIISSVSVVNAIIVDYLQAFVSYKDQPIGWELFRTKLPFANPFEAMGFYSIHSSPPLPTLVAVILSILVVIVIGIGLAKSRTKILSISFLGVFIAFYYWTGIAQHNFFAYNRALTYTLPFIIVLFAIGLSALYPYKKKIIFFLFLLLCCLELYSGNKLLTRYLNGQLAVDASYISLKNIQNNTHITEPVFVENQINSSIPYWNLIWTNYFFALNNPQIKIGSFSSGDNKIPNGSLLLISKKPVYFYPLKVVMTNIVWENDYYKIGKICSYGECLANIKSDLSQLTIGSSEYEDTLLLSGWGGAEGNTRWSIDKEAKVQLGVSNSEKTKLSIDVRTIKEPQQMAVYVDDNLIDTISLVTDWKVYNLQLPTPLNHGIHIFRFMFEHGYSPVEVVEGSLDKRLLYVQFKKIGLY